jgi:hypothetical protein
VKGEIQGVPYIPPAPRGREGAPPRTG